MSPRAQVRVAVRAVSVLVSLNRKLVRIVDRAVVCCVCVSRGLLCASARAAKKNGARTKQQARAGDNRTTPHEGDWDECGDGPGPA